MRRIESRICLALLSFMIGGCAVLSRKKAPEPASPSVRAEFDKIQIDVAAGADKKALLKLRKLVASHPSTDVSDDALIIAGKIHFKNRDFQAAYDSFISVANSDVFSPSEAEALLWASKSLHRLGRLDEALSLSQKSVKIPGISEETKLEIYKLRFSILSELGDRLDALRAIVFIAEKDPQPSARESYRIRAFDFVDSRLNEQELETVARSSEFGFVRGNALYRVGVRSFDQRDFSRARDSFSSAIEDLQTGDLAEKAKAYITQIDSRRQVDSRTIGAVLPLTGKYAAIAQKTLKGLQLGLGIYGAEKSDLRLAIVDSEGNADGARRAVERLVNEDHVVGIVGSLLSKTANSVAAKADELGVPTLALSQKSGLTEVGPTVFRNALTSEMQVRQLVRLAMDKLNLKKFAILYPNDPYGIEYANLFWDEVKSRGGAIEAAQIYNPNEPDFSGPIQRLVGRYYVEDRQQEYKARLSDWYRKQKSIGARQKPPDELLPPIVNFEAIFVPDGIKALSQIAPSLAFYDVSNVRLLGTNLWNSDELAKRADKHIDGAVFVDSFSSTDPEFTSTRFFKEYQKVFGEAPGPFEAQAYDAGLILRQALASGSRTRADLVEHLARLRDFPGALGKLNFLGPHEIGRPIVNLTITQGRVVRFEEPAPESQSKPEPAASPKSKSKGKARG